MKRTWISSQAAMYRSRDAGPSGAQFQVGVAALAPAELAFGGAAAVLLGHDPVVLRAETGP